MTTGAELSRSDRARLNAPDNYRWIGEEVIYEKNQSALSGLIVGWVLGMLVGSVMFGLVLR